MTEKITVYEKPTCTTCRKLNKLFEENGIDYRKVNYFIEEFTEDNLSQLLAKAGLKPFDVLRRNELIFKELNITDETPSPEIIKLIVENPAILQRPIIEIGDKAVLARPIEKALDLIKTVQ